MLSSVNMGTWYSDVRYTDPHGVSTMFERASHAALRRVIADHPDWADPVRVLCSARPWSDDAVVAAAWVSTGIVPAQPVLLLHYPEAKLGADVAQGSATSRVLPPTDPGAWRPTRIRHWPAGTPHPQAWSLPESPGSLGPLRPTCLVRFSAVNGGVLEDLREAAAAAGGGYTVLASSATVLDVEFSSIASAMLAVSDCLLGVKLVGGTQMLRTAQFLVAPDAPAPAAAGAAS